MLIHVFVLYFSVSLVSVFYSKLSVMSQIFLLHGAHSSSRIRFKSDLKLRRRSRHSGTTLSYFTCGRFLILRSEKQKQRIPLLKSWNDYYRTNDLWHVAKLLLSLTVTRRKLFENFNLKNHAAEYLSIKIIYSYIVKLSF